MSLYKHQVHCDHNNTQAPGCLFVCVCVCVRACVQALAHVRVCVCVCARECVWVCMT